MSRKKVKEYDESTFGGKLFHLRMRDKRTLTDVSQDIGISANFLSELEHNKKEPSDDTVQILAAYYEIEEDELFRLLNRIPKRIRNEMEDSPHLQQLLLEITHNTKLDREKKEVLYRKLIELYNSMTNE
jgi:transcriptional regulator with XRE-family HTH domain